MVARNPIRIPVSETFAAEPKGETAKGKRQKLKGIIYI